MCDAEGLHPDPLDDDQAVVVETGHGLAVLCGCAHAGVANILDRIGDLRPGVHIALLCGGLHLGGVTEEAVLAGLATELERHQIAGLAIGHCTGAYAEDFLLGRVRATATRLACGGRLSLRPG